MNRNTIIIAISGVIVTIILMYYIEWRLLAQQLGFNTILVNDGTINNYNNTKIVNIKKISVVYGFFLNSKLDTQTNLRLADYWGYVSRWVISIKTTKMRGIIGYDGNSWKDFSDSGVELVKFDRSSPHLSQFSNHNIRFILLYNHLVENRHKYDYVLHTDISDVSFVRDPFPFIKDNHETHGYNLFTGCERPWREWVGIWLKMRWEKCYNISVHPYPFEHPWPKDWEFFNTGISGGHVEDYIKFLALMKYEFEYRVRYKDTYCDMPVFNYVLHFKWNTKKVFRGPPLHSRFMQFLHTDPNNYIIHK